jgi:chloramphenicol 3-O phosphotransferase
VIVLLNGTSSAGKTTVAKALQDKLPEPALLMGIDAILVAALPRRYLSEPRHWQDIYQYLYDERGRLTGIAIAPLGDRLVRGMHRAVAGLAAAGLDVIVDHVLSEPDWAADIETAWAGLTVLRVGLICPIEVAEQRERSRGNRTLGWARAHIDVVHATIRYDLTVDTSLSDPAQCAALIAAAMATRAEARPAKAAPTTVDAEGTRVVGLGVEPSAPPS